MTDPGAGAFADDDGADGAPEEALPTDVAADREPDIADPGRTTARAALRRMTVVAAVTIVAAATLAYLGTGGYRRGFILTAIPLVAIAGGGTFLALRRLAPAAGTWAFAAAVVGIVLTGGVVEVSPPSRGALRAEADALRLPFYEILSTDTRGNSRCAPCPVVVRRYRAPVPSTESAAGAVVAALLERRLMTGVAAFERTRERTFLRGEREGIDVEVTIVTPEGPSREPVVTVRLEGRR